MERNRLPVILLLAATAACGRSPAAVPTNVLTPPSTAAPSASPPPTTEPPASPAPTDPGVVLAHDSIALAATDGLRMRSEPGVEDSSVKLEPLLTTGAELFVVDGPVRASDYDWYLVRTLPAVAVDSPPIGWVAAADKDGTPWLTPDPTPCPSFELTATQVPDLRALACHAGQVQTITARMGASQTGRCFEVMIPWQIEPSLFSPCRGFRFLVDPRVSLDEGAWQVARLWPAFEDGIVLPEPPREPDLPELWPLVSVTGQNDHPSAASCHGVPDQYANEMPAEPAPDPALVVLDCRVIFVVSSISIVTE